MPSCTASCQLARVLLQLAFVLHSYGQRQRTSCILPACPSCLLPSCFPPACCLLPSCFLPAFRFPLCHFFFAFPSSRNLLACPSCLLPSCLLLSSCLLPFAFLLSSCLLSFPYSCNWLACSCSLLFSLCASFFAFPYFLLSACLCLLLLAIFPLLLLFSPACAFCDLLSFPYSCCFPFATAASVLHATLSLLSLTLATCFLALAACSLPCVPLFSDALPLLSAGVGGYSYRNCVEDVEDR